MHLSPDIQRDDNWAVGGSNIFSPSSPPTTPELSSSLSSSSSSFSSYATSSSRLNTHDEHLTDDGYTYNVSMGDTASAEHTPRGSWLRHLGYQTLLSLNGSSVCTANTDYGGESRQGSETPKGTPSFEQLTLPDIEALEELPGASGRRQCTSYRFGCSRVIKVSPHRNILSEARVLAYIKQTIPSIPVPDVFAVRQLRDATGSDRFCMLMEYIDGVGADEAACEWSAEETRAFMDSVQTLRQTLAKTTGRCIQAVDVSQVTDDDCEMSDDSSNDIAKRANSIPDSTGHDLSVQDELFDHIWQAMERGPFGTEADFVKSVGVAVQRRGAGAARLDLVGRMVDQLSKPSSATEQSFPLQNANLSLGNFLVRRTSRSSGGGGAPDIVGVLGWGQCGFYPAWWELAKMAASEDRLLVDVAAQDNAFPRYSQHVSVMLHVRDIIY